MTTILITAAQAAEYVATYRAKYPKPVAPKPAPMCPACELDEERAIGRDLLINAMKADGRYDQRRSGARA